MPKNKTEVTAEGETPVSPELVPAEEIKAAIETDALGNPISDENGEVIVAADHPISNPQFASPEEIKRLPLATVVLTKDTRTDRKTNVKRETYSARIVLDRITGFNIVLTDAEYGLIVTESGKSYVPLQFSYSAHIRFVKTVFENGSAQYRLDAFLADAVRISQVLDGNSAILKLYLARLEKGILPETFKPEVRIAKRKAD